MDAVPMLSCIGCASSGCVRLWPRGMSYEGARNALRRAVVLAFPCIVMLSLAAGFIAGWFVHG